MNISFLFSFFGYAFLLTTVGWFFYKRQKSSSDFSLGGRSVNYWVTAIATHATDMSAWLLMGFPGAVYSEGMFACWSAIGLVICMFLSWHFIAKPLRLQTANYNALTLSSYFEKRFADHSGLLRIISALIALFFFTLYVSAGIVALGRALEATFGFSYHTGITLGTLTVAAYTLLGGFIAIAWNDFLQGMFVLFVMTLFPIYALYHVGGWTNIATAASAHQISLALFPDFSWTTIGTLLTASIGWGIGYFGQPHILVNFMGIDNPNDIPKAKYLGITWQFVTLGSATLIGLMGLAFFSPALANPELVFINMVKALFNPLFAGFILCAILAAAVSTMDSQILVSASMLTQDLYKKLLQRKTGASQAKLAERSLVAASRLSGIAIILLSFSLAWDNNESIFALVRYAWCGLGSTFGPLVLMSLYSQKITRQGALTGIILGGLTAGIWKYLDLFVKDYAIIPGFIISLAGIIIVSRLTRKS